MKKICFFTSSFKTFDLSDSQRVQIKVEWLDFSGRDHLVSNKTRPRSSAPQTSDCTSKFLRLEGSILSFLFAFLCRHTMQTIDCLNLPLKCTNSFVTENKDLFPFFFFLHLVDISKSN